MEKKEKIEKRMRKTNRKKDAEKRSEIQENFASQNYSGLYKKKNSKLFIQYKMILLFGILIIILIIPITLSVMAQGNGEGNETLQAELTNLISYLNNQGYSWLINQSITVIKFINYDNLMLSIDNKILT